MATTSSPSSFWHSMAQPRFFQRVSAWALPLLSVMTVVLFAAGLFLAFFVAPDDYQQGSTARIMFVHVPAAWLALGVYTLMTAAALATLIFRTPMAGVMAQAAAPIGAMFTGVCLLTGALWGKPMWGAWWVWDARLTAVLVLFFLYMAVIALQNATEDSARTVRPAALLILVGFINIPVIKFAVDWWNTLHQPASVLRLGGPRLHPDFLMPLLVMALAYATLCALLVLVRARTLLMQRRLRGLQQRRSTQVRHA